MDAPDNEIKFTNVTAPNARSFVEGVLIGNGVLPENAKIIASCLVQADLRGVDTHGMNRIPSYMARVREGVLDAKATPSLHKITPVVAQVSYWIHLQSCPFPDKYSEGKWKQRLRLPSSPSRHSMCNRDGERIWHRYGICKALQPLRHVCVGGAASS